MNGFYCSRRDVPFAQQRSTCTPTARRALTYNAELNQSLARIITDVTRSAMFVSFRVCNRSIPTSARHLQTIPYVYRIQHFNGPVELSEKQTLFYKYSPRPAATRKHGAAMTACICNAERDFRLFRLFKQDATMQR
jgi:hypothetical protein